MNTAPRENADHVINRLGGLLGLLNGVDFANAVAAANPDADIDRDLYAREHRSALSSAAEWLRVAGEQRAAWAQMKEVKP